MVGCSAGIAFCLTEEGMVCTVLGSGAGLLGDRVQAMSYMSDGRLLVGTMRGVSWIDPGKRQVQATFDSSVLVNSTIRDITVDGDGITWLATPGGLARFDPESGAFTGYTVEMTGGGLLSDDVQAVQGHEAGGVWAGTSEGLVRYDPHAPAGTPSFTRVEGLPDSFVWDLEPGDEGELWVAGRGGLTRVLQGEVMAVVDSDDGLPTEVIRRVVLAPDGALWLATSEGLIRYVGAVE